MFTADCVNSSKINLYSFPYMTASQDELDFIEQTMAEVRRNWNVALQDDFNPIMIALEMLQRSNPAHDVESFMRLDEQLTKAMNIIVNSTDTLCCNIYW